MITVSVTRALTVVAFLLIMGVFNVTSMPFKFDRLAVVRGHPHIS